MERLKIGIDIDGVVASFTGAAVKFFNETYGLNLLNSMQSTWDFSSLGITKEQDDALWNFVDNHPNWWMQLNPEPDSHLLSLIGDAHDLYFITNRKPLYGGGMTVQRQSAEWLRDNFGLEFPTVICVKNKGPLVNALGIQYFIDDKDSNIDSIRKFAPLCQPWLKHQPYNLHYHNVPRAESLNHFLMEIGAI